MQPLNYLYKGDKYKNVKTPDFIILDLNLPRKSGCKVLKGIKNDDKLKLFPVVVLTTFIDDEGTWIILVSCKCRQNGKLEKLMNFEVLQSRNFVFHAI